MGWGGQQNKMKKTLGGLGGQGAMGHGGYGQQMGHPGVHSMGHQIGHQLNQSLVPLPDRRTPTGQVTSLGETIKNMAGKSAFALPPKRYSQNRITFKENLTKSLPKTLVEDSDDWTAPETTVRVAETASPSGAFYFPKRDATLDCKMVPVGDVLRMVREKQSAQSSGLVITKQHSSSYYLAGLNQNTNNNNNNSSQSSQFQDPSSSIRYSCQTHPNQSILRPRPANIPFKREGQGRSSKETHAILMRNMINMFIPAALADLNMATQINRQIEQNVAQFDGKNGNANKTKNFTLDKTVSKHFLFYFTTVAIRFFSEAAFLLAQVYLFGFTVPNMVKCNTFPCPGDYVDCFVSRSIEKTIFLKFMFGFTIGCCVLNVFEILYLCHVAFQRFWFGEKMVYFREKHAEVLKIIEEEKILKNERKNEQKKIKKLEILNRRKDFFRKIFRKRSSGRLVTNTQDQPLITPMKKTKNGSTTDSSEGLSLLGKLSK